MGAAGVAEVQEGLAGVHGEVGLGHPGTPGRPVGPGVAEVLLGRGECAQDHAAFVSVALGGEGAGEAQLEQAAGGRVVGAGQGVVEDVDRGGVVVAPGGLVGEVAQEAGAHVVVSGGAGAVQAGDPVLAGVGVAALVEAVPGDRLGQGGGQCVQAQSDGRGVVAVREEIGHGGQAGVQQGGGMLALRGGEAAKVLTGGLQERDEVLVDRVAVTGPGERGGGARSPVRGQRGQGSAGDPAIWQNPGLLALAA
ncbi:hypothetical protein ACIPX0_51240 [Streptomyces sp. NPDC090075]|uniref:hypothetical protein n=1 Tax=Streptomyces sp. NPDC090075 TaxID=3365937 RepID=UPI00381E956F